MEDGRDYINKRKKLSGILFETALPNEYLVEVGRKTVKPILGGRRFRLFKKFLRVPGAVETLYFATDNANVNYQGIGIEGYASWRIDPGKPEVAISTLDFFDEDDPMHDTNEKLKTICVEAVRHVIANMSIDDALKKKDEIGDNLKNQLRKFEDRWGILFDQVGIEKVTIMSEKLFEDLQAEYRDELRLNVETTRLQTDRQIATEQNTAREATESERLETDKKLELVHNDNDTAVRQDKIQKEQQIAEQARVIKEDRVRKDEAFKVEKQELEYQAEMKERQLKAELQDLETQVVKKELELEEVRSKISGERIAIMKARRIVEQTFTDEQLAHELVAALPQLYEALDIDNYSVFESGSDGGISPVGRILQEVISLVRANNIEGLFRSSDTSE